MKKQALGMIVLLVLCMAFSVVTAETATPEMVQIIDPINADTIVSQMEELEKQFDQSIEMTEQQATVFMGILELMEQSPVDAPEKVESAVLAIAVRAFELSNDEVAYELLAELAQQGNSDAEKKLQEVSLRLAEYLLGKEDVESTERAVSYLKPLAENNYRDAKRKYDSACMRLNAMKHYAQAQKALMDADFTTAVTHLTAAGNYQDAAELLSTVENYLSAEQLYQEGRYVEARSVFQSLNGFHDSVQKATDCTRAQLELGRKHQEDGDIQAAYETYSLIKDHELALQAVTAIETAYTSAREQKDVGNYEEAEIGFAVLKNYSDSSEQLLSTRILHAQELRKNGKLLEAEAKLIENGDDSESTGLLHMVREEIADRCIAQKDYSIAADYLLKLEANDAIQAKIYALAQICLNDAAYTIAERLYEALGTYELSSSKLLSARYAIAAQNYADGEFLIAAEQFAMLEGVSDSAIRADEALYQAGLQLMNAAEYTAAKDIFAQISHYGDAASQINECDYRLAQSILLNGDWARAKELFEALGSYADSALKVSECIYLQAEAAFANGQYKEAESLYASIRTYQDSAEKEKECIYQEAQSLWSRQQYAEAEKLFDSIIDYKDSVTMKNECILARADALFDQTDYAGAVELYANIPTFRHAGQRQQECRYLLGKACMAKEEYLQAIEWLSMPNYLDCSVLVMECYHAMGVRAMTEGKTKQAVEYFVHAIALPDVPEILLNIANDYAITNRFQEATAVLWIVSDLNQAQDLLQKLSDQSYKINRPIDGAIQAFLATKNADAFSSCAFANVHAALEEYPRFGDSEEFENQILYAVAVNLFNEAQYDEAKAAFETLDDYQDSRQMVMEADYQKAKSLIQSGNSREAQTILTALGEYKEAELILKADPSILAAEIANYWAPYAVVGNTVVLGSYEQDHNPTNGNEPIEWIVLDHDPVERKSLLLSAKALDVHCYHAQTPYPTWEKSDVRKWLNEEWLLRSFTTDELQHIAITNVATPDRGKQKGGKDTTDRLFLLDVDEVEKYLTTAESKQCVPTAEAIAHFVYTGGNQPAEQTTCQWWLRSPNRLEDYATSVATDGSLDALFVDYEYNGVRPAFWLQIP